MHAYIRKLHTYIHAYIITLAYKTIYIGLHRYIGISVIGR